MPFDGVPETYTELTPINGWGNEKLARLEMLLRTDFERKLQHLWQFSRRLDHIEGGCGTAGCALGLADVCGLIGEDDDDCEALGIHYRVRSQLFLTDSYPVHAADVTPLMVADAIRRYMLTGEVRSMERLKLIAERGNHG